MLGKVKLLLRISTFHTLKKHYINFCQSACPSVTPENVFLFAFHGKTRAPFAKTLVLYLREMVMDYLKLGNYTPFRKKIDATQNLL